MQALVIGTSAIARNHIESLQYSGVNIMGICGKSNREKLKELALDYSIPKTFFSWERAISETNIDSLILCTPPAVSFQILKHISGSQIACLVEKPAISSESELETISKLSLEKSFMAFNRRHYETVTELKSHFKKFPNGEFNIEIHESNFARQQDKLDQLVNNSIHVLDLILFITEAKFADTEILSTLKTELGLKIQLLVRNVPVLINIVFGVPGNTSMIYDLLGCRYILKPIEKMNRYNNFFIKHPSNKSTVRIYQPTWVGEEQPELIEDSSQFKPGFLKQSNAFRLFVDNQTPNLALCSIKHAVESLKLAYQLTRFL